MSHAYYGKPVVITYSGGKDSDVILRLAEECLGTDFEVINSHTTVDLPPTVYHIQDVFKRLAKKGIKAGYTNRFPVKKTMWELIVERQTMPTRVLRMCCRVLKETGTKNRIAVLGVRAAESSGRQGREIFGVRGVQSRLEVFFFRPRIGSVQGIARDSRRCVGLHTNKKRKRK
jgi:phosphoadenosine phosphosulfate reductase